MLFNEFVAGTGCRETEKNYQVYKELEIIYMNTDCTKEHIYEMGKKLVDNSKTEEEITFEEKIKAEIDEYKYLIKMRKDDIERYTIYLKECDNTESEIYWMKNSIKTYKDNIRHYRIRVKELKWLLG